MIIQLFLKLKSQRHLLPLFLLVAFFLLVLAHVSSYVLANREVPLSLAVQQQSNDQISQDLIDNLKSTPDFEVINVKTSLSTDEVFRANHVQGLLIVPQDYGEQINSGKSAKVTFYPAPGITNQSFATEQIAIAAIKTKARQNLKEALSEIGAEENVQISSRQNDLLDVAYVGPIVQASSEKSTPVYGVSALLILLAFLHAALTVPTRADKRLYARGKPAFLQQMLVSLFAVWIVWVLVIVLFFVFLSVFSGSALNMMTLFGFITIMLYVSILAAVLAQIFGKHAASWLFLPLFLLSMTLGGGLWGIPAVSSFFSPLVPVVAVSGLGGSTLFDVAIMGIAALMLFGLILLLIKSALFRRKSSRCNPSNS